MIKHHSASYTDSHLPSSQPVVPHVLRSRTRRSEGAKHSNREGCESDGKAKLYSCLCVQLYPDRTFFSQERKPAEFVFTRPVLRSHHMPMKPPCQQSCYPCLFLLFSLTITVAERKYCFLRTFPKEKETKQHTQWTYVEHKIWKQNRKR